MGVVSGLSLDNFRMLVRREVVNGCTLHSQRPHVGTALTIALCGAPGQHAGAEKEVLPQSL